jgi:hypothetical protein
MCSTRVGSNLTWWKSIAEDEHASLLAVNVKDKLYNNEYASFIDIYFYEFFLPLKPRAIILQNIWDTLSDILGSVHAFL